MLFFKILIDNRIGSCNLQAEHGLSIYVKHNNTSILCDTGASEQFLANAANMGIEPSEVDFCFISHGHSDHTGGVTKFLETASEKCRIYLSEHIKGKKFYSYRKGRNRDISTDSQIFDKYSSRLYFIGCSSWLTPDIAAVTTLPTTSDKPKGNIFLTIEHNNNIQPDNFEHELALAIKESDELVVFSPCTHNGLFNVVESCMQFTGVSKLKAFIGGLHFIDDCESYDEIAAFANSFLLKYPNAKLYTGHCTGDKAINILQKSMPHNIFEVFTTGKHFSLPHTTLYNSPL